MSIFEREYKYVIRFLLVTTTNIVPQLKNGIEVFQLNELRL